MVCMPKTDTYIKYWSFKPLHSSEKISKILYMCTKVTRVCINILKNLMCLLKKYVHHSENEPLHIKYGVHSCKLVDCSFVVASTYSCVNMHWTTNINVHH